MLLRLREKLTQATPIAPLITFRILFGLLMMVGAIRFMQQGWIERLYLQPEFFFKYFGFEWVQPLSESGMYVLLGVIALSAGLVAVGLFYRAAILVFFCSFTYLELIDATNYLNHYYLVILLAFLLLFLPANRAFSLDARLGLVEKKSQVPRWTILILIAQLSIVYTCAGIAKINPDWLFRAMPLKVWLAERTELPVLGTFFKLSIAPYIFSWAGMLYDVSIAYFLLNKKTRPFAYLAVIVFHLTTKILFNIGLFPLIMITSTLIFFPAETHQRLLGYIGYKTPNVHTSWKPGPFVSKSLAGIFALYFTVQVFMPFRHNLYPGNVLWTEEGYRFSWRVMLVEKHGMCTFIVKDEKTGRTQEIVNGNYLNVFQEKQMCIQPDFILQFAHHLAAEYQTQHGFQNPEVYVQAYVALNGRTSQPFIDPKVNLAQIKDSFAPKSWIIKQNF